MQKQVILLNGPSSSGKSTLAKALRRQIKETLNEEYEIVSIDSFLKMTTEDTIYEDDVYEISSDLCEKVTELLRISPGIIIDHVITSERIFDHLRETMRPYRFCLVRVTCPAKELRRREKERGDRCIGSAEASLQYLFPREGYDLTVDTFRMSAEECARLICGTLFDPVN